ncbi:MAG TPA: DNA repair protein RecN [Terriglobales bacterium]|nr:DNA repair protein RecN [Terriglobales bacterium]
MLLELRVENYAVIDNAVVEFAAGLNLLTGETGAGKSILIDALSLLLGERSSADSIRHGAEKANITGVFSAGSASRAILEENGIDSAGDELILRREVSASGKSRVFVNNQPAQVSVLKRLAPLLATIHAQNESLVSFDAAERLRLIDRFGGLAAVEVAKAYGERRVLLERIAELQREEQDRLRLIDLWSFQKREIEQAKLDPEEDVRLEAEKRILANAEKLFATAMSAHELLYESAGSAATRLGNAAKNLQELARYDERFQEQVSAIESARITAEDIGNALRDYAESIQASPARLAEIEDRLALLDRLKRKYGATLTEVIAFGAQASRKLEEIENREEILKQLRKQLETAASQFLGLAREISRKRQQHARRLEKMVEVEINALAIRGKFKIEITANEEPSGWRQNGFDEAAYLISTNPGEPMHALEQVASGGELSRVMLALKSTIETGQNAKSRKLDAGEVRTLVFDEIDTGIGGQAAEAVGKKLKALSATHQVFCVTHLPQIACFADQHYVIEKNERREGGSTRVQTSIRLLSATERTQELARMMSGASLTETSLAHAEQMLKANA